MSKETIIFVKGGEEFNVPEKCEGIFYPLKFDSDEFLKWKNELDQGVRAELLRTKHKDEVSLYSDIYDAIDRNFTSAADREYMTYTRFLVDPRDPEGELDVNDEAGDPDPGKRIHRPLRDSECRFGGKYKDLYSDFMTVLRHCAFNKPCVAPKYILEALDVESVKQSGEYGMTYDSIPRESWQKIFRWPVVKNFIENKMDQFPELSKIIDMYGEPVTSSIGASVVNYNGNFVDIVDKDDSSSIVAALIEVFGTDNVKYYELLS